MKIKIAAISNTKRWEWKALVELDVETLRKLTSYTAFSENGPPEVGTEVDLGPILKRLVNLEERERRIGKIHQLQVDLYNDTIGQDIVNTAAVLAAEKIAAQATEEPAQ